MRYLVLLGILFFASCKQNKIPADVLPAPKMELVFWDFINADIYTKEFLSLDTTLNLNKENAQLQAAIFKKHQITRQKFYKSYNYYATHEKLMRSLLDSITAKQQRKPLEKRFLKNIDIDEEIIQ